MSRRRTVSAILGTLALAAVLIGGVLVVSSNDGGPNGELASYYFEARVEVVQGEPAFGDEEPLDTVRGWYESPGRWRWEFLDSDPARSEEGSIQVSDGDTVWFYDRPTNTFYRQDLAKFNEGRSPELTEGPPVFVGGFLLGWLPYGNEDRFFEPWGEREESAGGEIAGREARKVTLTRDGTTTRFWLDRDLPFILRFEARDEDAAQNLVHAEVVDVRLNEDIEDQAFTFEPPPEAQEVEPPGRRVSGSGGTRGAGGGTSRVDAPEGFLSPDYVPTGFIVVSIHHVGSSVLGGDASRFTARLERGGAGYLEIDEQYRAGGLAKSQRTGRQVPVGSAEGYDQSTDDITRLVWAQNDIVVTLTSDVLPVGELVRIGESLR